MKKHISEEDLAATENNVDDDVFVFPASFAQQRLWFINELEQGIATYNIPAALRLEGTLHVAALEQALAEIVRRHEVLRTTFKMVRGSLIQVIAPTQTLILPRLDLQSLAEEEQSYLQQLIQQEAQRPFDLAVGPLLYVSLLQLREQTYVLLVIMHHIISDGWSIEVFIREVADLYQAFSQGLPSPLPELPVQYGDFTQWQKEWLSGEVLQAQVVYWQQQLAGAPPFLEMPTDRARPPVQTFQGGTVKFQISSHLAQSLINISQKSGATLFMTLLAAFMSLLNRYSSQEDIVVGSPIANRNHHEIESLIGFFVNTLVLRVNLQGNPTFLELLSRVKQVALDAYAHQDLPFEHLVEALQPERSLSHSPLFQIMFVLQNAPNQKLELPGLVLTPLELENTTAKFDLLLSMAETDGGLVGVWEYNTDLFDAVTIHRMNGHFQTMLAGIVAHPQAKVSELPLLTPPEQQQLLVEWNDTQTEYSLDQCIHQMFAEQVERTPEAIAVVFEDQQLTYRELNVRANKIAHYLQTLGVGPDVLVGICMERSLLMAVALLGILKAGGAYVPLDPAYPQERLAFILEDTRVPVLLTQQHLGDKLPAHVTQVVHLDSQWDAIALLPDTNPDDKVHLDNLLYIIYTSGSTGRPKGIALPHRVLSNLIQWHLATDDLSVNPTDTLPSTAGVGILQFASLNFDASIHEMFAAWCAGGTLFMIPDSLRLDIDALIHFLAKNPIQKVILPVVILQKLAEAYGHQQHLFQNLRQVITTGEQLQINQAIIQLFNHLEDCSLHNHYGPSETHVVTAFSLSKEPETWSFYPPIGKPIAQTQIYILDKNLQPVPIGVPGELYIGGVCLAHGYFNRPELTEEKFIPNPFDNSKVKSCLEKFALSGNQRQSPRLGDPPPTVLAPPGTPVRTTGGTPASDWLNFSQKSKLYKTGDLARYLPDGNIEFLGRIDHQLKIRGFRVEPGEIEAVLNQHPQVNQAVVMAKGETAEEKRLIAYIVPFQEQTVVASELRKFLQQKLPDYMIPGAFVSLDALPLNPNGKVDRRALPEPDENSYVFSETFVAPRTPTEEFVAQMWTELLGIEKIGIYSNFFHLGGHSLLATQFISSVRQTLSLELPVRTLFESPTVAELVEVMAQIAGSQEILEEIVNTLIEINQLSGEEIEAVLSQIKTEL